MLNNFRAVPTSSVPTCLGIPKMGSTTEMMSVTASCLSSVRIACLRASACGTNSGLISLPWLMTEFPSDGALMGDSSHTYASFLPLRPSHPFLTFPFLQQRPVPQKVGQNPDYRLQASLHSAPSFMSPWFTATLARGSIPKCGLSRALGLRSTVAPSCNWV